MNYQESQKTWIFNQQLVRQILIVIIFLFSVVSGYGFALIIQQLLLQQERVRVLTTPSLFFLMLSLYLLLIGILLILILVTHQLSQLKNKAYLTSHFDHQLYKEIVENAEEGIWILDPSLNIVYVNAKLSEILSMTSEELLAKNALELCFSETCSLMLQESLAPLKAEKSVNLDLCLVDTQTKPFWFYVNSTLIDFYGQGDRHILGLLTDITERKQIEEDLKAANERLTHQANFDELTQIANRRYFNLYAIRTWKKAIHAQQSLSLVLADIDFFKKYNDHYGHLQGDICLFQVAQVISAATQREDDLAARYGGEEFVLLFPNTMEQGVRQIIEKLQHNLNLLQLEHKMSPVKPVITLSLGVVAGIPHENITLEQALNLADEALYEAKSKGRNQYVLWDF